MLNVEEILKATNGKLLNGNVEQIIKKYKIDSREIENGDFYIPLTGSKNDGHDYIESAVKNGAIGFFTSKDIELSGIININNDIIVIKVNDTLKALHDIGVYNRNKHNDIEVIAVTGSVGKTSTREMIAAVLNKKNDVMVTKKNMNGHIGLPLMDLELENQKMAVFEAGVDFVGEMDLLNELLLANVAVITNIGVSHIEKFKTQDNIYKEKIKIANSLIGKKILLLNKNDNYLKNYTNDSVNIIFYSADEASNVSLNENSIEFDTNIYNKKEHIIINAIGEHNILNAIVAIKIAQIYKMDTEDIIKGIASYTNYSRRMEVINLKDGITLIDDTYNASLSSATSGLVSINNIRGKRKIALLSDILELGEYSKEIHEKLGTVFKDLDFQILIMYGKDIKNTYNYAKQYVKEAYYYKERSEAEEKLKSIMTANDIIYFKGSNGMKVNNIVEDLKRDFMN